MRILSPCGQAGEVEALAQAGADELYCGFFPQGWYERWGRGAWPNRRGPGPANVASPDELLRLSDAARRAGRPLPVYVALNQQFYTDAQADFLLDEVRRIHAAGGADAWILGDPGFMALLRAEIPGLRVFASTVAVSLNAGALGFFAGLGCERVILSRHLQLRELRELVAAAPRGVALEVFLSNDNCYFEEGFCSTTHTMPGFGVYCMTPWELLVRRDDRGGAPLDEPEERARWDFLVEEHREYLRSLAQRGFGDGRERVPLGPCGLCAIPALVDLGIHSGKIVGREANLYRKIRSVQAVRYVRDSYLETGDARLAKRRAVELRGDARGCASGYSCYYREARDRDLIPLPRRPRGPRAAPRDP